MSAIQLSCPDFAFPLLSYEQACALVRMLGFSAVDVGLMEGRTHHQPSVELVDPAGSGRALLRRLARLELRAADVFFQAGGDFTALAVNAPDDGLRMRLRSAFARVLEYTAALDCRHVTLLPGAVFVGDDGWTRCVEELCWRVERAASYGVTVGVEAHIGSIVSTPELALRLVREAPGLTLTLDCSHFERQGIAQTRAVPLLPHTSHLHARGANGRELQCPMCENTLDFPALVRGLQACGYAGYIDTEYTYSPWENSNRTDNVSEILQVRDVLRAALAGEGR